ncbi:MAG: MBL fold metallo-hydrolase [Planctomycetaceae bacterium]
MRHVNQRFVLGVLCLCLIPAWICSAQEKDDRKPELEIRVVFDNTSAREDLNRSWGFSAVVDFGGRRLLFDAGSDPILLLEHLEKMQIDPKTIDQAIISLRGVYWVFEKNPKMKVHFLDSFPDEAFRRAAAMKMKPNRVKGPFQVIPGIYSTGTVEGLPSEQSLIIETSQGLVMIVGCSHPGLVKLVETAQTQREKKAVSLLLGGFHLLRKEPAEIQATIKQLEDLNVKAVIPAHCSGDLAKQLFQRNSGDRYHTAGAGRRIVLDNGEFVVSTLPDQNSKK